MRLPPPNLARGPIAWVRENLFSSPFNTLLTLVVVLSALRHRSAARRSSCSSMRSGPAPTVRLPRRYRRQRERRLLGLHLIDKLNYFIYGSYTISERWRVNIFFAAAGCSASAGSCG